MGRRSAVQRAGGRAAHLRRLRDDATAMHLDDHVDVRAQLLVRHRVQLLGGHVCDQQADRKRKRTWSDESKRRARNVARWQIQMGKGFRSVGPSERQMHEQAESGVSRARTRELTFALRCRKMWRAVAHIASRAPRPR